MDRQPTRPRQSLHVVVLGALTGVLAVPLVAWGVYAIRWDEEHEGEAMGVGTMFGWASIGIAVVLVALALSAVGLRHRRPSGSTATAVLALTFAVLTGGGLVFSWVTGSR